MPVRRSARRRSAARPAAALAGLGVLLLVGASVFTSAQAAAADPRAFPQTGYRVDDDRFWDYFQKRGGVRTLGYPASREFQFLGCTTQFFQRLILQRCGNGGVATLNLLDAGLLPYTRINGSTFPAPDPALVAASPSPSDPAYGEAVLRFVRANAPDVFEGEPVGFARTFVGSVRLEDAFPDGKGEPGLLPLLGLEIWGLPTSRPQRDPANANFVYQRFQRGIMHYDKTTGATQGLLLADYLKALLTGQNLPGDLEAQARSSPLYRSAANGRPPAGTTFGSGFLPPLAATPTPVAKAAAPLTAEQRKFIDEVGSVARRLRAEVGLPPSLVVAIAINETGWGQSTLSRQAHNYFGIKALRGTGTAGSAEFDTWEVIDGQRVEVKAPFRVYRSLEESVRDLGAFLRSNPRYANVWKQGSDPAAVARALLAAGYATDPAWPDKLIRLIERYQLTQLDRP